MIKQAPPLGGMGCLSPGPPARKRWWCGCPAKKARRSPRDGKRSRSNVMDDTGSTAAAAPGTPKSGDGPIDFIRAIVDEDLATGTHHGRVATRFPPEPN